jgi:hypothetical protein
VRDETAEQLGLHGDCLRISQRVGPVHAYGPAVPADDPQILRLLAALYVAVPRARDWTENQKAIYFRNFLFALWPAPPPNLGHGAQQAARDQAREQLVVRLTQLRR